MEAYYDPTGDLVYIRIRDLEPGETYTTRQVSDGFSVDFDRAGNPLGFEVLSAASRYPAAALAALDQLGGPFLSLAEAGGKCGLSAHTLKLQAQAGRLKAEKHGRNWVTTEAWLADYLGSRKFNAKALAHHHPGLGPC